MAYADQVKLTDPHGGARGHHASAGGSRNYNVEDTDDDEAKSDDDKMIKCLVIGYVEDMIPEYLQMTIDLNDPKDP